MFKVTPNQRSTSVQESQHDSIAPLVTVCVPVRNGGLTIRRTLDSILAQDYPNFEVIVSDNCSIDDTASIVQQYASRGVKYYLNPKLESWGESNWNHILSLAKGPFIALYHADDLYTPTMVRRQVEFLQAHPEVSSVFTGLLRIDESDRPIRAGVERLPKKLRGQEVFEFQELFNAVLKYGNFMPVPTLMTRRETLDSVGVFNYQNYTTASDIDLWLRMARWRPIGIIDEPLHRYRISNQQGTAQIYRLMTQLAPFFLVLDDYLRKSDVLQVVQPQSLSFYEMRKSVHKVFCAMKLLNKGQLARARVMLSTALCWRSLLTACRRPWELARLLAGVGLLASIGLGLESVAGRGLYRIAQWKSHWQKQPK